MEIERIKPANRVVNYEENNRFKDELISPDELVGVRQTGVEYLHLEKEENLAMRERKVAKGTGGMLSKASTSAYDEPDDADEGMSKALTQHLPGNTQVIPNPMDNKNDSAMEDALDVDDSIVIVDSDELESTCHRAVDAATNATVDKCSQADENSDTPGSSARTPTSKLERTTLI